MKNEQACMLITGGAGFIGSNLADALLQQGNNVVCYDNLSPYYAGKQGNIRSSLAHPKYRFVNGDILDPERLEEAADGVNVIFHLAAQPGVRYSIENATVSVRINVEGTTSVLEAARKKDVGQVVFASSSAVYGNPTKLPAAESDPTNPISPYGASKLAAEQICRAYSQLYGARIVILRYFTVYGPRQRPDMAVSCFLRRLENYAPLTIFGDGKQTRDLTFVGDIVQGTMAAAQVKLNTCETLNLGGGLRVSVLSLVDSLSKAASIRQPIRLNYEPRNPADASDTHADIRKAHNLIGFSPRTKLEDGLKSFVDWYRAIAEGERRD